ncbi:MAG: sulfatase-like hydrolase/transferase [Pirellulales bacterium]|nr:sulfatase-like hydrolase/transferase [Pirellulales bacterium]
MRTSVFVLLLTSYCASASVSAADRPAKRPNVLFLLTDDQRADTIGALGNPVIKTPNLDRLATGGFAFRNAYVLGSNSGAVCLPSRNMLMSGRAYFRFKGQYASPEKPNFPDSMKEAGYETWHEGKRGNTERLIHPRFDHTRYLEDEKVRTSGEHGKQIVDDAIGFLAARRGDKPFFMYLAFAGPHDPRVAAEKYMELYDRSKIPLPANYLPLHPFDNGEMTVRDEKLEAWPRTEDAIRKHLHDYYACITSIDGHIGRLFKKLEEIGQFDNTVILFSSDNGLAIGSHGLMGKQSLYEHSSKVPLVFFGPGIPKGKSDALVYLMDIYPTVCELVGAAVPAGLDGKSFAGILRGQSSSIRDTLFTSYRDVQRAIHAPPWKLIRYPQIDKTQLFHLAADPHELNNLSGDPAQAGRIKTMMDELRRWQEELGDKAPLEVENPRDPAFTPPAEMPTTGK